MLAGPSGVGKSILARAIAWKLGRNYIFISATELLAHFRNQTCEKLHKLFKSLAKHPDEPVLILDELNALTDTYIQQHADTIDTVKALWTELDKLRLKGNMLLIGTSNITNKMPHQLQTRFTNKIFKIDNPITYAPAIKLWLDDQSAVKIAKECNDRFFEKFSEQLHELCLREVEALVNEAIFQASIKGGEVLTKKHFGDAYLFTMQHRTEFCDYNEHLSDEERRHCENKALTEKGLQQNQDQFEESLKTTRAQTAINNDLQLKLAYLNQNHQKGEFEKIFPFIRQLVENQKDKVHYAGWKN